MDSVLVTGGAGAIGSRLVPALLEAGFEVTVLDDLSSGRAGLVPEGARLLEGSVENEADLAAAFDPSPRFVFHLAALFANQNSVDHPEADLRVNGLGTLRLFERCAAAGVEKTVYTSSSCVYGLKALAEETDTAYDPGTPYAMTKLLGERYAAFWAAHRGLNVAIARLFNNYGPGEHPGPYRNVIPNFFALALRGEPLPITGDGTETRDFNYVDDTVDGLLRMLRAETAPGDVFNLASGRETAIGELAERINAIAGNPAGVEHRPRRSWDHVTRRRASIEKARRVLGYDPDTPLRDGLERTCAWIRDALETGEA